MSAGRILVVDDSPLALRFAQDALSAAGFDVTTRDIALGTAAAVLRLRPDLLLLDVCMPALDGDELVRFIRSRDSVRDTIVLLYSSKSPDELKVLAASCGASGYCQKVADPQQLVSLVRGWLAKKESAER